MITPLDSTGPSAGGSGNRTGPENRIKEKEVQQYQFRTSGRSLFILNKM